MRGAVRIQGGEFMSNATKLPANLDESIQPTDENTAERLIEEWGGVEWVMTTLHDHEAMTSSLLESYPTLLEEHPDQWIAWGREGTVILVSDSQDDLLCEMQAKDIATNDVVIEYLDTDPRMFIL